MAEPRRTPSALRHGLFSRHARLEWSPQVQSLGDALLGASPRQPQVIEAAREAAEAILWLRQIQQWRLAMLERAALFYANPTAAERDPALRLSDMVKGAAASDCAALRGDVCAAHDRAWLVDLAPAGDYFIHQQVAEHATELRRLADYERRAHSRRRKALRRLDYERVEAERCRVTAEAARWRGGTSASVGGKL